MNPRSRIPTVFGIYMLDVICCALGCVILLWQLKHVEAEQETEHARNAEQEAKLTLEKWKANNAELISATAEIDVLRHALDRIKTERAQLQKEKDDADTLVIVTKKALADMLAAKAASEAILKSVRIERDQLEKDYKISVADLASKVKANAELLLALTASEKKVASAEKVASTRKMDAEEAAKRLAEQLARLQSVELKNKDLDKQLSNLRADGKSIEAKLAASADAIKALELELEKNKKDLTASGVKVETLAKQLLSSLKTADEAMALIDALRKDKAALLERAKTIQAEADRRFAGIALTGKNVLFLVDISGSMAMADARTADPAKWPQVCESLVQLMRSIKGLEHFQVLSFSDKVGYPVGSKEKWIRYDPDSTPQIVLKAMKAVQPEGETNMHLVFAEAFRYRPAELDTIYILSDGLPNAGEGLPPGGDKLPEAKQIEYLTRDLRDKLKNKWNAPIPGQNRVRINAIGFFFESPDVGAFLWALAREHDGSFVGMSK